MDKLIKENITILHLLVEQIKGLNDTFITIYETNFNFIADYFYPSLKNDYSYVVYDEEKEKYRLVQLVVDINYSDDAKMAGTHIGAKVITKEDDPFILREEIQSSIQSVKIYLEQTLNRMVSPREVCVYINTETLLGASIALIFLTFFSNKYTFDKLVPMVISQDCSSLNKAVESIWKEYRYNLSAATSSIGIQLSSIIFQQTRFSIGVLGIPHYEKNMIDMGENAMLFGVGVNSFPISLR